MSLLAFLRGTIRSRQAVVARRAALAGVDPERLDAAVADWSRSLADPTGFYLDCFRAFHLRLPEELRAHRAYFTAERRGFGEDAFHTMWSMLFERFKFRDHLEIGVYRGQTLSLAALLQHRLGIAGKVTGVSPFSAAGDSVSKYPSGLDYQADTLANFAHFGLPQPTLLKAYSTDPAALDLIRSQPWDCIYIDGNHDYEVARADWEASAEGVRPGGVIVLDDSALDTTFVPPAFATAGHPGPSRLATEIDRARFREILRVGHDRVFQRLA
jgi:hypothetical protein